MYTLLNISPENLKTIIDSLAAGAQIIAAVATVVIVSKTGTQIKLSQEETRISQRQTQEDFKQAVKESEATVLNQCLTVFMQIRRNRVNAEIKQDQIMAQCYYRELIDVFWLEFQLWKKSLIPDNIMESWIYVRQQSYKSDKILIAGKDITYREEWKDMLENNYFKSDDPFVDFMNMVHSGQHQDAIKKHGPTRKHKATAEAAA